MPKQEPIPQTQPLFDVNRLSVCIDHPTHSFFAVRHVSFSMEPGETLALVGESGSGKTMTALAILGLLPKRARHIGGEIRFGEYRITRHGQSAWEQLRGKQIAMIFQEARAALNPVFRVGTQITDVIRTHLKLSDQLAKARTLELLDRVGLPDPHVIYRTYPHQLSGGMAQRVMIAMALSCHPRLIIADELTTALDVTTQMQILNLIADLQKQQQFALLLISHDMAVVSALADTIAVMYRGRIVEKGQTAPLFSQPKHPYTRSLVEATFTQTSKIT